MNGIPCCLRTEGGESSNLVCARRYEQGFLPKELQNFAQRRYEQGFQRKELQNFAPFVRWLQRANKVEYVNMFVILSGTGRGIRKQ